MIPISAKININVRRRFFEESCVSFSIIFNMLLFLKVSPSVVIASLDRKAHKQSHVNTTQITFFYGLAGRRQRNTIQLPFDNVCFSFCSCPGKTKLVAFVFQRTVHTKLHYYVQVYPLKSTLSVFALKVHKCFFFYLSLSHSIKSTHNSYTFFTLLHNTIQIYA